MTKQINLRTQMRRFIILHVDQMDFTPFSLWEHIFP